MRSYFDKAVIVIFNKERTNKKIEFELPERYQDMKYHPLQGTVYTQEEGKIKMTLPGNSFEILTY